ncbi:MAG: hypothetical protein CMI60_02545, partial [Parvibaculum sp.]|nr:hypothetical protein [Parvibaculum sp.]
MISEKEALEIIQWGKTQGYSEQQSIDLVNRRDYELKVIAERARLKKEAEAKRVEKKKDAGLYHELDDGIEITEDALNEDTYTIINGKPYTKKEFGDGLKNKTLSGDEIRQGSKNQTQISNFRFNLKKEKQKTKKAENVEDWYGLDDVDTKTNTFNFKDAGDLEKNILKSQGIDMDVEYFKEGDKWFYKNEERENIEVTNLLAKANLNLKIETGSEFKDFDKILDEDPKWEKNKGVNTVKPGDNILSFQDDDYVAGTLQREYGDQGFEFSNTSQWSDGITVT